MSQKITLLLFTILSSFQLAFSLYSIQSGNQILDLYSKSITRATSEASTWTASQVWSAPVWRNCGGTIIVGGYGTLGTATSAYGQYYYKTWTGIPTHTYIYYAFNVWAIDTLSFQLSASDNDYFAVQFDSGTLQAGTGFNIYHYMYFPNLCGTTWADYPNNRIYGRVRHSGTSVTMKVFDYADQHTQDESFGFREVSLVFANPASDPGEYVCVYSELPMSMNACACPEGQYSSGGTCLACHPTCSQCMGPLATHCYQCVPGTSYVGGVCITCTTGCAVCQGTGPTDCDQCLPGYFLFNGNTCVYPCDLPLVQSVDSTGVINSCTSPCASTSFVYWDGSCNTTCIYPLQQDTMIKYVKQCYYPCPDTSYLYWDGSCGTACEEPLLISTYLGKNFCNYDCVDGKYLLWNGTCSDSCLPPLILSMSRGKQFCTYPCALTQYLAWDGSCLTTCDYPLTLKGGLTTRNTDANLYCDYPCLPTEYLYWDGTCSATCKTLLNIRTQSTIKPRQFCEYLGTTTSYLYWNGTYLSSCYFPLVTTVFKQRNFCTYPCASTEILFWNGTCLPLAKCASPLLIRAEPGARFCDFPTCPTTNHFYYWDGSCATTCPDPLTQITVGGTYPRYICSFGCSTGQYLYWNRSCISTCTNHFTTSPMKGRLLCHFPCNQVEYLQYDGTCKENCLIPLRPRYEAENNYCDYPCLTSDFLYWNGTCLGSCDLPLRIQHGSLSEQYCLRPCDDPLDYYNVQTGLCQEECDESSRLRTNDYLICLPPDAIIPPTGFMDLLLTASAEPGEVSFLSVNKLSGYIRFMDIQAPPRLSQFMYSKGRSVVTWNVGIKVPDNLRADFPQTVLPKVFAINAMASSFTVNFWSSLIMLAVFFLMACAFKALEMSVYKMGHESVEAACTKLRQVAMFNMCFMLLGYYADDVILFAYLDISTLSFSKNEATVNLLIAIFMLVLVVGFFIFGMVVIHLFRLIKTKVHVNESYRPAETFHRKWQSCSIFYRNFKGRYILQQSFYLIYVCRMIMAMIFTIVCKNHPALQSGIQIALTCMILGLVFILQPLKRRINHVQLLCYEVGVFVISLCSFLLSLVKPTGSLKNSEFRTFLGDLVILGNVYLNVAALVFLAVKLGLEIWRIYFTSSKTGEKGAWVRLLVIFLQQGAFGFEELLELPPRPLSKVKAQAAKLPDPFDFSRNSPKPRYLKNKANRIFPESELPAGSQLFTENEKSPQLSANDDSPLSRAQLRRRTLNKFANQKRAGGTIIFGDLHPEDEVMNLGEAERDYRNSSSPGNSFRLEPTATHDNFNQENPRSMDATHESGFSVVMGQKPNRGSVARSRSPGLRSTVGEL